MNPEILTGFLGLLSVTFLGFIVYCFALPCNHKQSAGHADISCAHNKEALNMVSVLDNGLQEKLAANVDQKLGERVNKRIQDPLESLRLYLEECHKQEPKSAVIADDTTRILTLIDEVSEHRKSRDVLKIIEKLEKIVDQIQSFRKRHDQYVSETIFEEVKKAISFCKEEVKKTERIKQIKKNLNIASKAPNNRAGFQLFTESIEDLTEIVDDDPNFLPKESLKFLYEFSSITLEKTDKRIENSERKDKLRRRLRYASYFLLQRIEEICPLEVSLLRISKESKESLWNQPLPPTEGMKKVLGIMKDKNERNDLWSGISTND